jgi:hypothetical protein
VSAEESDKTESASSYEVWLLVASAYWIVSRVQRGLLGDPTNWHIWARWATVLVWTAVAVMVVRRRLQRR